MEQVTINGYERIDKRVARRLYNDGKDIIVTVNCLRPDAEPMGWLTPIIINKTSNRSFDDLVDNYINRIHTMEFGKMYYPIYWHRP